MMLRIAHCQSVWMKEIDNCKENMPYKWECVGVTHFRRLLTWSTVPRGDLRPVLEAFSALRNGLLTNWTGPEVNQILSNLADLHLTLRSGLVPQTVVAMRFFDYSLLQCFCYIKHDICTLPLYLNNCTRQTDILASCASVAKCFIYCRQFDTQGTY